MKAIVGILFVFMTFPLYSQCPNQNIFFFSQTDVDSFGIKYGGCTILPVSLTISGSDITDLSPLSSVNGIDGDLNIVIPLQQGMAGFENISFVNGRLSFSTSGPISGLELFTGLVDVGDLLFISCASDFIEGPESLERCTRLSINSCNNLTEIRGFSSLHRVDSGLSITSNDALVDISSFNALTKIGILDPPFNAAAFVIFQNDALKDISGFNGFDRIGANLRISFNDVLEDISGFQNVTVLESELEILSNPRINRITGFNRLDSILGRRIEIHDNDALKDLSIIPEMAYLDGSISIRDNDSLQSTDGIERIRSGWGLLSIANNPMLGDCSACCVLYGQANRPLGGFYGSNAAGCNSKTEVEESCVRSPQGHVFNIDANLITGLESRNPLENATVQFFENGNLLETTSTNSQGFFEFYTPAASSNANYRIEVSHSDDVDLLYTKEYDQYEFSQNLDIDFPLAVRTRIGTLLKSIDSITIMLNYLGGAIVDTRKIDAYNTEEFDDYLAAAGTVINSDHELVVEALKRQALGMHLLDSYLTGYQGVSGNLTKSAYESMVAIYEFIQLFSKQAGIKGEVTDFLNTQIDNGNLTAAGIKSAAHQTALDAALNGLYNLVKIHLIDPYLGSLGKTNAQIAFVRVMKALMFALETSILNDEGITGSFKEGFKEIMFNAGTVALIKVLYIDFYTQEYLADIIDKSVEQDGTFEDAVHLVNEQIALTQDDDNRALMLAEFIQPSATLIKDFGGYLEALSVALLATGYGVPAAAATYEVAQRFGALGLGASAAVFPIYGIRVASYPGELFEGVQHISVRSTGQQYPPGFFDTRLVELDNYFQATSSDLSQLKTLFNSPNQKDISQAYVDWNTSYSNGNALDRNSHYLNAISSVGVRSDTLIDAFVDANYLAAEIKTRKITIDMMTLAYFMDTTSVDITQGVQLEMDTLLMLQDQYTDALEAVYSLSETESFDPLLLVSEVNYSDSLIGDYFIADVTIENFGPATTDSFSIDIQTSDNLVISMINGDAPSLPITVGGLGTSETLDLAIEFEVTDKNTLLNALIMFDGEKSIDHNQAFIFNNIQAFTGFHGVIRTPEFDVRISPNPAIEYLNIHTNLNIELNFEIFNMHGELMEQSTENRISIKSYPPGMYLLHARSKENAVFIPWVKE